MLSWRRGVLGAVVAYLLWGVLPVYWKALKAVPAGQILAHRILWSFLFLAGLVLLRRELGSFGRAVNARSLAIYALAAALLSANWLIYIWAVNANRIVETSLGYFINPLVSVVLAVGCLRERLRPAQWVAVTVATVGVGYLTWQHGSLPWVALALALTFGLYGLLKKTAPLGALHGLTLETAILWLPALGYLGVLEVQGESRWLAGGWVTTLLLALTGVITATPLLLFASATRQINLSTIGVLQYLAPSCQLAIGVAVYREPFDRRRALGFALIWAALAIYSLEGVWRARRR